MAQRPYSPKGPFVVQKPFNAGGRVRGRGELYDPTRDAVSDRRVRQLWEQRKIRMVDDSPQPEPKPEPQPEPEPEDNGVMAYEDMTMKDLRDLVRTRGGVPGRMNKGELIQVLRSGREWRR
jgi:hypothetical protein